MYYYTMVYQLGYKDLSKFRKTFLYDQCEYGNTAAKMFDSIWKLQTPKWVQRHAFVDIIIMEISSQIIWMVNKK